MRKRGLAVLFSSIIITAVLFVMAKENPAILWQKPFLAVSQMTALFSMVFFSYAFLFASRLPFLENTFGGMDKVYKLHQISGRFCFILLVSHFIFLVFNYIKVKPMLSLLLLPGSSLSYNLGIWGIWSFALVLCAILYIKIDYQWFIRVQTFFIIPYTFGVLHMLLIPSDASRFLPLTIWLLSLSAVAYGSWIYKTFLYPLIGPSFRYCLEDLKIYPNDVAVLTLSPVDEKMDFLPGQFAYVYFDSVGVSKEFHPFSIASSPLENSIRLAIKSSGDFTTQVKTLKIGESAVLRGPYGKLCERFFECKDTVCIAGGIGVTPFLSLISYFKEVKTPEVRSLHLFYSVRNENDNCFEEELHQASVEPNVSLSLIHTEKDGRLSIDMIKNTLGEVRDKLFFLCGPKGMMEDLSRQLKRFRIPAKNIIYEDFSFR